MHIFLKPNGGYCVFIQGRILVDLFSKLLNVKLILFDVQNIVSLFKMFSSIMQPKLGNIRQDGP